MKKFSVWLTNNLVFILTTFFTFLLYLRLGRDPLFNWDEGIYAELGRELINHPTFGHFLTPTWNYQPWLEKPPAIAWLTALSQWLFGHNAFGVRFFMPFFAFISLFFIYKIGLTLTKSRLFGILSLFLLANMNLFLARSRGLNTDGPLLAGIVTTFYLILNSAPPLLVAFIIASSVFFKGLAGFLALIIALPLFLKTSPRYIGQTFLYLSIFILPWHLYQLLVNKNTFWVPYFQEQVFRRFTTPIEYHFAGKLFYLKYLFDNLGPSWLFLLALGILIITLKLIFTFDYRLFSLLWWFFFPLLFFTFAKTKLFWYILPIYPAIALLVSYFFYSVASLSLSARRLLLLLLIPLFAQTTSTILHHIDYRRSTSPLPPRLQLANYLSSYLSPSTPFLVLVTPQERQAFHILPPQQRISSSFRYGGIPNLPFYARHAVQYYYDPHQLVSTANSLPSAVFLLTKSDYQQFPISSTHIIKSQDNFVLIQK